MDSSSRQVKLGAHQLALLPAGGLYWPVRRMLIVADLHLGKESTFQRQGIPVPGGTSGGTLSAVGSMICHTNADQVVFLGDLVHHRSGMSPDVIAAAGHFFDDHRDCRFQLVEGNHDLGVASLPSDWPLERGLTSLKFDGLCFLHDPADIDAASPCDFASSESPLFVAGHLHPAVAVPGGEVRSKLPCFWLRDDCLVLPAVGKFTGTMKVRPRPGDRVWVTDGDEIFEMPQVATVGSRI